MTNYVEIILKKIEEANPKHAVKLYKSINEFGKEYFIKANAFYEKYNQSLESKGKTLDFGVECYMQMLDDMLHERMEFFRNGKYSSSSFDEVEKRVYGNQETMTYHMHGLVLAQYLWYDQYQRILFFSQNLKKYGGESKKYLEIGGGHGLYINEAAEQLTNVIQFDLVDISQSSIDLAKGILKNHKINFILKNIFDFDEKENSYDFITIGEVIEHLEDPLSILKKIAVLLSEKGVCYITTPINAPMIDHIYLFKNEDEIRKLLDEAGFEIMEEKIAISDNETAEYAKRNLLPVMYAAFVRPKMQK